MVKELSRKACSFLPIVGAAVIGPSCPYFIEGGYVVRRIGETHAHVVGGEGDEVVLGMEKGALAAGAVLGHGTVENATGFGLIVDTSFVTP